MNDMIRYMRHFVMEGDVLMRWSFISSVNPTHNFGSGACTTNTIAEILIPGGLNDVVEVRS
ncbi:hypothetical protein Hanom_Chr09g00867351 [Helianthus anomalus]